MGKLFDADGRPLKPSHAKNHGRQYRYYISRRSDDDNNHPDEKPCRLSAQDVEGRVLDIVGLMLKDGLLIAAAADAAGLASAQIGTLIWTAKDTVPALDLVDRVTLWPDSISVTIALPGSSSIRLVKTVPMMIRRWGHERRLVIPALQQAKAGRHDARLIKALGHGLAFWEQTLIDPSLTAKDIGKRERLDNRYVGRALPLAFLAPDLVEAIATGQLAGGWSAERVLRLEALPLALEDQRRMFERG